MKKEFIIVCKFDEHGSVESIQAKGYKPIGKIELFQKVGLVTHSLMGYISNVHYGRPMSELKLIKHSKQQIIN
jgi:hypothetical protein